MTKEEYTKIVNFMTPRTGALLLGRVRFSHITQYYFSKTLFFVPAAEDKL